MKHALITGAAVRIGREIALTLARNEWDITIHYRHSQKEAEELAREIRRIGQVASLVCADLERKNQIAPLFSNTHTPFTALVNNASLFDYNEKDPDGSRHLQVNYHVPLNLTATLREQMPEGENCSVVHFLDNTPLPPVLSSYAQSRTLLRAEISKTALFYAPHLRVNAVALGPSLQNPREPDEHFNKMVNDTPLRCPSKPEDVAKAVLFLLETPSVTGQILNVDSGLHLL